MRAPAAKSIPPLRHLGASDPSAVVVGRDAFFVGRRVQWSHWCVRHAIPVIYGSREICRSGGLMSYGTSIVDTYPPDGACYVDRMLKGAKPADLPVEQSTKFELVINLKTARMLGLDHPADAARPRRRGDRISAPGKAGAILPVQVRPK